MCGIVGVVSRDRDDAHVVPEMADAIAHRGPDGRSLFEAGPLTLLFQRLSIIDVQGGMQPLWNEDFSVGVVVNGEIYNFVELRTELEKKGHRFRTRSDCEVIPHLYEEYGCGMVHRLRGMFVVVLVDLRKKRLYIWRDRMGEKPLYLLRKGRAIFFSSELRALFTRSRWSLDLDPIALKLYLLCGYVPDPMTPFAQVSKLPAGHLLDVNLTDLSVRHERYWHMEEPPRSATEWSLDELVQEAVSLTLRSDVPVGISLSGGLDSGLVAALASKSATSELTAFSVGYAGANAPDESLDALELANRLGIPCNRVVLTPDEVATGLPGVVARQDDPIADIAASGYDAVMRAASETQVKVLLQGQGGDELFWGYPWVRDVALFSRGVRATITASATGPADRPTARRERLVEQLHRRRDVVKNLLQFRRRPLFYELSPDYERSEAAAELLAGEFLGSVGPIQVWPTRDGSAPPDVWVTHAICATYLRENGIAQADRLSMARSVEVRLPLVDHRLVESVLACRMHSPDSHLPPKRALRGVAEKWLPREVLARPKRGFTPPVQDWLASIFREHRHLFDSGALAKYQVIRPSTLRSWARNDAGGIHSEFEFRALILEMWIRYATEAR